MTDLNQIELGDSWIDQFLSYLDDFPTPYFFKKWTAIGAVASALEKRVRIPQFNRRVTYPNLFILMVGKPGQGKTAAMDEAATLLKEAGVKLSPKSTTAASLYDDMLGSLQAINVVGKMPLIYSALTCLVDELAVWMPVYDNQLAGLISELWDGKSQYSESRRSRESKPIENPILNILAGVQPAYLAGILPRMAHEQGLLTRCLIIFSHEKLEYNLSFSEELKGNTKEYGSLLAGLKRIKALAGDMSIAEDARKALIHFHKNNPGLEDEKFLNYNNRRILSVVKLAMVASASLSNDLIITEPHINWAVNTLMHAENFMPEAYREMGKPESAQIMTEIFSWARNHHFKMKKPIPEHRLLQAIHAKAPVTMVAYIWKQMVEQRYFKKVLNTETVGNLWVPIMDADRD